VLADDYIGDVTALTMDDLRAKRAACQSLEVGLSYLRRMAQGRLDIVAAEVRRRSEGGPPPDPDDLVRSLSGILADHITSAGNGRLPQLLGPSVDDLDTSELDAIAGPGRLVGIAGTSEEDLGDLVERLATFEADVSARRRALHERIDVLQAELTRRYKTGEASVETLLK